MIHLQASTKQWHSFAPPLPQDIHQSTINSGLRQIQETKLLCKDDRLRVMGIIVQRVMLLAQRLSDAREKVDSGNDAYTLTTNALFQTYGIDSFDSDCDKVPAAQASFMTILYYYGSYDLFEVPNYNTYHDNTVFEQNVQEMQDYEQPAFVDDSNIKLTSESNIISYEQYLKEKSKVVHITSSHEQQNAMIISVIDEMSNQVGKCNTDNQEPMTVNESLIAKLKIYKEQIKIFKERHKFDLADREKYIDSQLRGVIVNRKAKLADFENQIKTLKLQLSATVKSHNTLSTTVDVLKKESKAKEDNQTIVKKHDALSMIDIEETLILAKESRINMLEKTDPIVKEKKVDITPIDYVTLNKLFEHFVPQKQLSTEQSFWLPISKPVSETPLVQPEPVLKEIPRELPTISLAKELTEMKEVFNQMETKVANCFVKRKCFEIKEKELLLENERILEYILYQDVMCIAMHADLDNKCVVSANNDNNIAYASMEKSYVEAYNQCLELKAELVKEKDMIEQYVFIELSKSYSKLEKHCISLEIVVQQSNERFQNDKPCENQDALEFHEFFEINNLKAQLQAKNTTISNLKNHIQELKGKSVADCTVYVTKSKVIALEMFKLDLEPLSPKFKKNKKAHVNYFKTTKDNANTLCDIVEQARTSNPSDSALEYTCMYAKQIQELLVYASDTCLSS
uniref:Integrase, catalytic region, zinc finger, CCHC-type, peptidase aspartic, catalytic n=1 Tax=Tanacetum cinerariifolium TaxID=118510 RepID=A0A699I6Q8_TANCI|nr:hypothetical protein [Tanacetum cinerariifolium]